METLDNKYKKYYYKIIEKYRSSQRQKNFEKHHILPKCCGGNNSAENLVYIPTRVHFLCHRFLVKFVLGKEKYKLAHAVWLMMKGKQKTNLKINSRLYEVVRAQYCEARSVLMKGRKCSQAQKEALRKCNTGRIFSKESRDKISKANKGRLLGLKRSQEFKDKLSKALLGHKKTEDWVNKINKNPDKIRKTAEKHRGMKRSKEARENMSLAKLGKPPHNLGKKYYYNPNTHEKILCNPQEVPPGFINGVKKSRGVSKGTKGNKYYYNPNLNKEICVPAEKVPVGYLPGRRRSHG